MTNHKLAVTFCAFAVAWSAQAQSIFVNLLTSTAAPGTTTVAGPTGYSFSGAAPVIGNVWNTVGESSTVPAGQTAGTTYALYNGLALVDSSGSATAAQLSVSYTATVSNGTRVQPSGGSGENVIQPGGVMQNAWRNYFNASGNYFTFTISGLAASTAFDLYFMGGTGSSGQNAGISLAAGNILGVNPGTGVTLNTTANFNGAYGSLFDSTDSGATYQLMAQGTTWEVLHGQSDASGVFSFDFLKVDNNSQAYMNGFQLVQPVPEPGVMALVGLGALGLIWRCRRVRR